MSAHAAPHPVVPGTDNRCDTCRRPIAYVEDVTRVRPHWRHKAERYRWGDPARRELLTLLERRLEAEAQRTLDGHAYVELGRVRRVFREALP